MKVVVDTNVPKVANGVDASPQATQECVLACVKQIGHIHEGRNVLVLDDRWRILSEYIKELSPTGQPGLGDAFLKWVLTNHRNPRRCELVPIVEHPTRGFEEFPADPALAGFDREDRKFVAVSRAHAQHPPILNAVDTDWWHYREAFKKHNVHIEFLCPELMT